MPAVADVLVMPWQGMLLSSVLAFIVGFAIQRGSLCCVVAARQIVEHRRWHRPKAFLLVACWSAVVVLPLSWLWPEQVQLSAGYPVGAQTIAAASVYGVGAYLNNACVFGTLSGLTRGEVGYLATIAGMIAGAVLSLAIQPNEVNGMVMTASPLTEPALPGFLLWMLAFVLVVRAVYRHYRASRNFAGPWRELVTAAHWRPAPAMAVLGVAGGLLYATAGEWTYLAVLSDRSAGLVGAGSANVGPGAMIVCAALVSGGILSARLAGRFAWQRAARGMLPRRFVGGAFMSGAAAILPGGNDALLLYGLPSGVLYAFVGYTVMILSLCALLQAMRWVQSRLIRPAAAGTGR